MSDEVKVTWKMGQPMSNTLMFPPNPTDRRWDEPVCVGFQWMGQSFDTCDGCGRDITEHIGLDWAVPGSGSGPFDRRSVLIPFQEAMDRIPLFAHLVTPIRGGGPFRWERKP